MKSLLAAATAAAAITVAAGAMAAGTAQAAAKNVCVWTGHDWACGDGNTFPQHFSEAQGPNIPIVPQQTGVEPAREPTVFSPPGPR